MTAAPPAEETEPAAEPDENGEVRPVAGEPDSENGGEEAPDSENEEEELPPWVAAMEEAAGMYGDVLASALAGIDGAGHDPDQVRLTCGRGHMHGFRPYRALLAGRALGLDDLEESQANLVAANMAKRRAKPSHRLNPQEVDADLVAKIGAGECQRLGMVPLGYSEDDGRLTVAVSKEQGLRAANRDELMRRHPDFMAIEAVMVDSAELSSALDYAQTLIASDAGAGGTDSATGAQAPPAATTTEDVYPELIDQAGDRPEVGKALARYLALAIAWRSADLHVSTHIDSDGQRVGTVRLEYLGTLRSADPPISGKLASDIMGRIAAVSRMQPTQVKPSDSQAMIAVPNTATKTSERYVLRISSIPLVDGSRMMTVRFLPLGRQELTHLDKVFPVDVIDTPSRVLRAAIERPDGLILVTGRTGDGKSTTLAALIHEVVRAGRVEDRGLTHDTRKIVTVENPVEYRIPGTDQVQVSPDQVEGFGFPAALRAFLRSAPDIIMVGEIRDHDTASAALRAAETGHLVLSTLHVKDVASAVGRLRGLGASVDEIGAAVSLITSQRLLRCPCTTCSQQGCSACSGTGWARRMAVMEALEVDEALLELLNRDRAPAPSEIREMQQLKFVDHAKVLVEKGHTTPEEVRRVLGQEL